MEGGLQPQMVRPQLYISSMRTELYREVLETNGITHILQVGTELQPSHPQHFKYLQLPIADWPEQDIVSSFPAAFDFIDAGMDGGGGVLVHCQAGISRSASFLIAYCMWKERLSADAATAVVSAARSAIFPNLGFQTQLQEFERLGWDASRWQGWSMSQFLDKRYGGESVDFMAAMLGGAPETSGVVRGSSRKQQPAAASTDVCGQPAPVSASPFAQYRAAAIPKACGYGSSSPRASTQQRDCKQLQAADSLRRSSHSADQRSGSRGSSKSPAHASTSLEAPSAKARCPNACSSCPSSRSGPNTARRASHAYDCGKCGTGAGASAADAGGNGRRLRRHSTGQQYAQLAAAAGATAVTHMSLMSLSARTRLPEEAALLMAG